jgi:hypothetical protein
MVKNTALIEGQPRRQREIGGTFPAKEIVSEG